MTSNQRKTGEKIVQQPARSGGMRIFLLMWASLLISALGSNLTGFALGVWVYQQAHSITQFALISFFVLVPGILISPLVGVLVDRWDLRWTLILSDVGNGLATLTILLLVSGEQLAIWHIYGTTTVASMCLAFQWTAYNAAIPLVVPVRHLGRANGISQMILVASTVVAPGLAGILIEQIQIQGIIIIDLATFALAFLSMWLLVRIPHSPARHAESIRRGSLSQEARAGWTYLWSRPGLVGLLPLLAFTNVTVAMVEVLINPLILSFASPAALGKILSIGGLGVVFGSLLMSVWGGPQRRIYGVLGFLLLQGLVLLLGGLKPDPVLITGAIFVFLFSEPIVAGCSLAIWQSKVEPELLGRVMSLRRLLSFVLVPLAYLSVGPLTNTIFEPLLAVDGPLADTWLGHVIGTGTGRGIGLIFVFLGVGTVLLVVVAFHYAPLRNVEQDLPNMHGDVHANNPDTPHQTELPRLKEVVRVDR